MPFAPLVRCAYVAGLSCNCLMLAGIPVLAPSFVYVAKILGPNKPRYDLYSVVGNDGTLLFTYAVGCASLSSILLVCVLLELADLMRPLFSF